ncbi:MAG: hypothetical protein KatS3mg131_1925 [Candidatus Tectimicrobiota bacterium]|nr:MAG: hypothetical protein KatS3mg131_1925 [Candidatus Tectomicrobia bacterium]
MAPLNRWEWLSLAWFVLSLGIFVWGWIYTSRARKKVKQRQ